MQVFKNIFPVKKRVLALGGESEGIFCFLKNNSIVLSDDFGDLLEEKNFQKFKRAVFALLKKEKPKIILSDLHPLYKTTFLAQEISQKYKIIHLQVQHHLAHIFSALGEKMIVGEKIPKDVIGIACDGTGYGWDGKIWGGEIFHLRIEKKKLKEVKRIGHLENQIMIGGDLAVKEPARILIGLFNKFLSKEKIYYFVKKYYNKNQFELLYNQLQEKFNCQETSSTGRVLDAVSLFLGFSKNERGFKHKPIKLLEENSTQPYKIKPKIFYNKKEKNYTLLTTPLFEYLIKSSKKDKKRLAGTAQRYIAQGLYEIAKKTSQKSSMIFFAGGIANNKIISSYLEAKGIYTNKKIPRGDKGLSFGQLIFYLCQSSVYN